MVAGSITWVIDGKEQEVFYHEDLKNQALYPKIWLYERGSVKIDDIKAFPLSKEEGEIVFL